MILKFLAFRKASSEEVEQASPGTMGGQDVIQEPDIDGDLVPYDKYGSNSISTAAEATESGTVTETEICVETLKQELKSNIQKVAELQQQLAASLVACAAAKQECAGLKEELAEVVDTCASLEVETAQRKLEVTDLGEQLQDSKDAQADVQQHLTEFLAAEERLRRLNSQFGLLNRPVSMFNAEFRRDKGRARRNYKVKLRRLEQAVAAAPAGARLR